MSEPTIQITEKRLAEQIEAGFMAGAKHALEKLGPQLQAELEEKFAARSTPKQGDALSDEAIRKWWASENGFEDCDLCCHADFREFVRAVEARLGAAPPPSVEPAPEPVACVSNSNDMEGMVQWATKRIPVGAMLYAATPLLQVEPAPSTRRIYPPEFPPMGIMYPDTEENRAIWAHGCLTGWRCGDFPDVAPPPQQVEPGWVRVPIEPTPEMRMLAAAPHPPKPEPTPNQPGCDGAFERLIRWARIQGGDIVYSGDHPIARAEALLSHLLAWTREEEDHCGEFGEGYDAAQRWIAMQLCAAPKEPKP